MVPWSNCHCLRLLQHKVVGSDIFISVGCCVQDGSYLMDIIHPPLFAHTTGCTSVFYVKIIPVFTQESRGAWCNHSTCTCVLSQSQWTFMLVTVSQVCLPLRTGSGMNMHISSLSTSVLELFVIICQSRNLATIEVHVPLPSPYFHLVESKYLSQCFRRRTKLNV